jgi:uncharacterized membrane protein
MAYSRSIDIAAPVERVWQVMSDVERWPDWTASITTVHRLDTGPLVVGSRAKVKQPKLPGVVWTVTELTPDRGFVWTAKSPGVRNRGIHRVEPVGDGESRVTLGVEEDGPLGRLAGRLLRRLTKRYVDMEAEGLKKRVEGV